MSDTTDYDLLLVGGGLQNGLIAVACLSRDPSLRVAVIERGASAFGDHVWSVHPGALPAEAQALVDLVVAHRWPGYAVRFPNLRRELRSEYASITTPSLSAAVAAALARSPGSRLLLGRSVSEVSADGVTLDDGERLSGRVVIDARGPGTLADHAGLRCGYQKFLGLELELADEHGLSAPILMDATVPQQDGFRFFYVLPLAERRLLVEDTVFSTWPELDGVRARNAALSYAGQFGRVLGIARTERGVLPMPWAGTPSAALTSPLAAGYQGGWFHPATGYSLPVALRLAVCVAEQAPDRVLGPELAALQREQRKQVRFAQQLNRLLFHGFAPSAMWNVFERFYGLPEAVIERFYALTLTGLDRARLLIGRPPRGFSLRSTLAAVS
jgi:lycopene beta-cyclase